MKLSLALTLLAIPAIAGSSIRGLQSQECPGSGPSASCTMDTNPVICGINDCEYDNACLANLAGFAENQCTPKGGECPDTGPAASCAMDMNPVICGINDCEYDNACLANLAGFADNQCSPKESVACPGTGPAASCTMDMNPVVCGINDCEYDNACLANLAGFADNQCSPKESDAVPCNPTADANCEPNSPPVPELNGEGQPTLTSTSSTGGSTSDARANAVVGSLTAAAASIVLVLQ